jgi:hypothetical protein
LNHQIIKMKHAVEKEKWLPQGIENVKKHRIDVDFD